VRTRQYRRIEKAIAAHDRGGIWERWCYGRLLLVDDEKTTPAGNLRHGVLDKLIAASARDGLKLNESEIQRRLRAGRAYPTEEQIRELLTQLGGPNPSPVTDFETWTGLWRAGFPPVPAPEEARPYDPRETNELVSQQASSGARLLEHAVQGSLFPRDDDTLAEAGRWMVAQDELTARFVAAGDRRHEEYSALVKAANGDLTKTVGEAKALLAEADGAS